jgi:hypothetical protein
MFRINGHDPVGKEGKGLEFFYKVGVEEEGRRVLCNLCIDDDGIFYYRAKSSILSPGENKRTRTTYNCYLSMEELKDLFEALIKAGLDYESDDVRRFHISRKRNTVIIEAK